MFLSSFACEPAASNNSHNVHTLHKKNIKIYILIYVIDPTALAPTKPNIE